VSLRGRKSRAVRGLIRSAGAKLFFLPSKTSFANIRDAKPRYQASVLKYAQMGYWHVDYESGSTRSWAAQH
jgi:hypothetical protein